MGKCRKADLPHVVVIISSPLFHTCKIFSKLAYLKEVRNYGKLFIYLVKIHFLAIKTVQKPTIHFQV